MAAPLTALSGETVSLFAAAASRSEVACEH